MNLGMCVWHLWFSACTNSLCKLTTYYYQKAGIYLLSVVTHVSLFYFIINI